MTKVAFTLAEVLITLGIIGVVGALTIPSLMTKIQANVKKHQVEVIQAKLKQGMELMSTAGEVGPYYSSSEDFVRNGLSKHMKISQICDSNHLRGCFSADTIKQKDNSTQTVANLKTFNQLGGGLVTPESDNSSDNVGIIFGNGTRMILNWNKNCPLVDPESRNETPFSCITGIYDINGNKGPNKRGEDILGINTFSKAFVPTPISKSECESLKSKLGINACNYNSDYWAGAVKECGGVWNLPTEEQILFLGQYIYNDPSITTRSKNGLTRDNSHISSNLSGLSSSWNYLWSSYENSAYKSKLRGFYPTYIESSYPSPRTTSYIRVFCINE